MSHREGPRAICWSLLSTLRRTSTYCIHVPARYFRPRESGLQKRISKCST